jgi:triosephosphate isomerase
LRPIVCIGETLNQKQSGQTETVLANQLDGALNTINASQLSNLVVAYEPVWAIGSSVTPTAAELGQLMQIIKNQLVQMFGSAGQSIRLLYGGSVDTDNAGPLLAVESVNGFLVGSSSLNMDKFATIVKIAEGSGND